MCIRDSFSVLPTPLGGGRQRSWLSTPVCNPLKIGGGRGWPAGERSVCSCLGGCWGSLWYRRGLTVSSCPLQDTDPGRPVTTEPCRRTGATPAPPSQPHTVLPFGTGALAKDVGGLKGKVSPVPDRSCWKPGAFLSGQPHRREIEDRFTFEKG